MILIEIKKEARYLKQSNQTPQEKTAILTDQLDMAFGSITLCFSVERDLRYSFQLKKSQKSFVLIVKKSAQFLLMI